MRSLPIQWLGLWATLWISACAGPAAPSVPNTPIVRSAPANAPPAISAPQVELLDQGWPPRRAVRYDLARMGPQTAALTIRAIMEMQMGGMEVPTAAMRPYRILVELRPEGGRGDGLLRYTYRVTEAESLGAGVPSSPSDDAAESGLEAVRHMLGWGLVDDRGAVIDFDVQSSIPPTAEDKAAFDGVRTALHQLLAVFPPEPLGRGARWQVRNTLLFNGLRVEQRVDYRLERAGHDQVVLSSLLWQEAAPQPLLGEEELQTMLRSYSASGTGRATIDLTRLVPQSALTLNASMSGTIENREEVTPFSSTVQSALNVEPTPQ